MQNGKARIIQLWGALLLLLVLASCKKEVVPPDVKEEPVFYVQGKLNNTNTLYQVGVNGYSVEPDAGILEIRLDSFIFGRVRVPYYVSTLTDGNDSFQVMLLGDEFVSSHEKPRKDYLESVLGLHSLEYDNYVVGGNVNIAMKQNGKWYTSNSLDLPSGVHFDIIKSEDYQVPGTSHFMKKVDVTFKIVLAASSTDLVNIEDGKACLLFSYQE